MKRTVIWASALLFCAALAGVCVAQPAQPAAPAEEKPIDPWKEYVLKGDWQVGQQYYRKAIVEACKATEEPDFKRLAELHYAYNVCRWFPAVDDAVYNQQERRKFIDWLLANRELTEKLLLSFVQRDDPARAFAIVYELVKLSPDVARQFSDLTVTFAVVWDRYPEDPRALRQAFGYCVGNNKKMQFDLRTVPPEVAKYIIDSQRPMDERDWALKNYAGTTDMGKLYDKIWQGKYDYDALLRGSAKKVDIVGDTLPNILKYGGVCHEAAIFASEVGKAIGVPSVYIHGVTQGGMGHAWVGYLRKKDKAYAWDFETGRLSDESTASGSVMEPQAGVEASEHELDYALAVLRYREDVRRSARIWCDVAKVLLDEGMKDRAKAAMYKSLNTCVYDKIQWTTFAQVAKETDVSTEVILADIGKFCDNLKDYPNLAVGAFACLVEAVDPQKKALRLKVYEYMAKRYADDPEAFGRIRLLHGRYLESMGDEDAAVEIYADAAAKVLKSKKVMLDLLDNAARVLIKKQALEGAVKLHAEALQRVGEPRRGTAATFTTTWFQIGVRLAKLRQLGGDRAGHDRVLGNIMRYQEGSDRQLASLAQWLSGLSYYEINTSQPPMKQTP